MIKRFQQFSLLCIINVLLITLFIVSCNKDDDDENVEPKMPESVMAGGETTIFSSGPDAYTFPLANLSGSGESRHFESDQIFDQAFVTSPADQFDGVGPLFNQSSCVSCHVRNGRGTPPAFDGDPNTGFLLRISMPGAGQGGKIVPVSGFGGQLHDKAIFGVDPEGTVSKTEAQKIIDFVDGKSKTLTRPTYYISDPYTNLPSNVLISPRIAPPVHGLGLLEAIPEDDILALQDINDNDGDGISGKANRVWDATRKIWTTGRFGWKAEQPNLLQQSADAAKNDMGLTNTVFPTEHCDGQSNCTDGLQSGTDIDQETLELMAFYPQTLAVPARRNYDNKDVVKGEKLFAQLNCNSCHVSEFTTGNHEISELSNQTIYPYTDLLLHDMGEGLADNRPTFQANGREWRTPPLWGIGLAKVVNSNAGFLHDGRAKTLEEAILWHGGEAEQSKESFVALSKDDREKLIAYLNSL